MVAKYSDYLEYIRETIKKLNEQRLYYIHLDIDNPFSKDLFYSLYRAIKAFGYERLKLYKTASGSSLQLRIEFPEGINFVEALVLYHLFTTDPYRLSMCVRRAILRGEIWSLDISFQSKTSKEKGYTGGRVEIPLREIFPPEFIEALDKVRTRQEEEEIYNKFIERLSKYLEPFYIVVCVTTNPDIIKLPKLVIRSPYDESDYIIKFKTKDIKVIEELKNNPLVRVVKIYEVKYKDDNV